MTFASHIVRIKVRMSGSMTGRPGPRFRLFHVQYRLKPERCQRVTVSGFTMTSARRQSFQIRNRRTQENPVDVRKPWSFHRATKNRDLLPQREILKAEGAPGLQGGEERAKERRNHAGMLTPGERKDQA